MAPINLAFSEPGWLLAAPLALLPLLRRDADTVNYSWLALVPPDPPSVGELVSVLFDVAGGPRVHRLRSPFAARLAHAFVGRARRFVPAWLSRLVSRFLAAPTSVLGQLFSQATYDDRNTRRALAGTEVVCPSFRDIAPTLWEGWRAFAGASSPALPAPRGLPSPEGDALVSERSGPARASSS